MARRSGGEKSGNLASALKSIKKIDSSVERRFLIGMVASDEFCDGIDANSSVIKELLPSKSSKLIYDWCLGFYNKYGVAIKSSLSNFYEHMEDKIDDAVADDVKEVLSDISKQHSKENFSVEFELDGCRKWLDELHLKHHHEEIEALRDLDRHTDAIEMVEGYERLSWNEDSYEYDPYSEEMVNEALNSVSKPMFSLGGGLGDLMDNDMVAGGFVCVAAPDKAGKSFLINAVQHKASLEGCSTIRFEAGDLSAIDYTGRLITEISKTPINEDRAGEQWIPIKDCMHNQNGSCNLPCSVSTQTDDLDGNMVTLLPEEVRGYTPCTRCEKDFKCAKKIGKEYVGAIWKEKIIAGEQFEDGHKGLQLEQSLKDIRKYKRRRKCEQAFYAYPNGKLSFKIIRQKLLDKRKQGIEFKVLLLDYIDLIMLENYRGDKRNEVDEVFKLGRALSQEFNILVFTVTQSAATAYNNPIVSSIN